MKPLALALTLAVFALGIPVGQAALTAKRAQALDVLWGAYTWFRLGDPDKAIEGVERALSIDPEFAYANIVRGEIAMSSEDWVTSQYRFERGLKYLREPNQPLAPMDSLKITPDQVEADTRCFLGYAYIKLAKAAYQKGKVTSADSLAARARVEAQKGLALGADAEPAEMAHWILEVTE